MNWSCSENGYMKNITLIAWSAASEGKILARHTILVANENKDTYSIKLTLDVPSKSTGTGSSLVLDGRDTAMLRSAIVDDDGALGIRKESGEVADRVWTRTKCWGFKRKSSKP